MIYSLDGGETYLKVTAVDLDQVMEAVQADRYLGYCVHCGAEADSVEPDARRYKCHDCGEFTVYGAEELLIRMA